jgi:hypothetical protein
MVRNWPGSGCTVVLQLPMLNGCVVALTAIVQQNAVASVFRDGKTYGVGGSLAGNPRAQPCIAHIAKFPQLIVVGRSSRAASGARAAESGPQGQPAWKLPENIAAFLDGKKVRTRHSMFILVPICGYVIDFFSMTEPTRLEMLTQFLEQKPDDAFARYGLALEYSKLGQTETALQQFNQLLELHPDYTSGYFMAAQTLARVERNDEAKAMLQKGIESAKRTGNRHALNEMSAMLDELS